MKVVKKQGKQTFALIAKRIWG